MPVIEQKTTNKNKVDFDLNRLDKSKTTIFSKYPKKSSLCKEDYMKDQVMQQLGFVLNALNNVYVKGKANLANLSGSIAILEEVADVLNNAEIVEATSKSAEK